MSNKINAAIEEMISDSFKSTLMKFKTEVEETLSEFKLNKNSLELYTVKEVAKLLKISQKMVYLYIKEGKLNALILGNQYRITHEELEHFIGKFKKNNN